MVRVRIVILWSIAFFVSGGTSSSNDARQAPAVPLQRVVISGQSHWVVTTLAIAIPGALGLTDQGVIQDLADDPVESDAMDLDWSPRASRGDCCGPRAHFRRSGSVNPAFSHAFPIRC